jgi:hypothetical protein
MMKMCLRATGTLPEKTMPMQRYVFICITLKKDRSRCVAVFAELVKEITLWLLVVGCWLLVCLLSMPKKR